MPRSVSDYTVACICPTGVELAPVRAMLDQTHPDLPTQRDQNSYVLGEMAGHNMVIAVLPETGTSMAGTVAVQLLSDFPSIRFGLLVGTGGGVPDDETEEDGNDIRLGDVVVSKPTNSFGGVVQYDMGKFTTSRGWERTGLLNKPPALLRSKVEQLAADHRMNGSSILDHISAMLGKYPKMRDEYSRPDPETDLLFRTDRQHLGGSTCHECDRQWLVERKKRHTTDSKVHYGTIGSANVDVRDALLREKLRNSDMRVLCLETEAAGLMNDFPCLIIHGICDYADSHQNERWRPYAAAVAAAYMKELLSIILPNVARGLPCATTVVQTSGYHLGLNLFDVPVLNAKQFVGREETLERMRMILQPDAGSADRKILVLGGMGGIGKTQLAITHAKRCRDLYSSIFWLNATSEITLKSSFRLLAQRIFPPADTADIDDNQIRNRVSNWLSETGNTRWLLIFDNYDEPDQYSLDKYYPYRSQGSIIITSRLPGSACAEAIQEIVKPLLSIEDGLEILSRRSERDDVHNDTHAQLLAKRLAGLPLALATAGAFLHKGRNTWTFKHYLEKYEQKWNVSPRYPIQLSEYDKTLYTTWDLSYDYLKERNSDAAQVLKLLAYFDHQAIWYELLHAGSEVDSPAWLRNIITDSDEFDGVMGKLVDHCFLEIQATNLVVITSAYSVHTCIHDWTLVKLNEPLDHASYWYAFNCVAASIRSEDINRLGYTQYAPLTLHAVRLTRDNFKGEWQSLTTHRLHCATLVGILLSDQGKLEAANVMYTRALTDCEKELGMDDPITLVLVNNLGLLYRNQGKLAEAEQMFTRALAGREKAHGVDHSITLTTVNNLGRLYVDQGKPAEAEQMFTRALAGKEKTLRIHHHDTLITVDNLSNLYRDQGKLVEAEQMLTRALAGKEKTLGIHHPEALTMINSLSNLYRDQGKLAEAEQILERALAGMEKALGMDHPRTLTTVNKLGGLYRQQRKLVEAEQMFTRALAGREKALLAHQPDILTTVHNLGILYRDQGKLAEAEQILTRVLAGREKSLGMHDPDTLSVVNNLGLLYRDQGKLADAEQILTRALAREEKGKALGEEKVLEEHQPDILTTVNNLGLLYRDQGKLAEAEQMFTQALAGREKALGVDHPDTLTTVNNLGRLYLDQDKLAEAEQIFTRALAGREKALGLDHPDTLTTVNNLGVLYFGQGKPVEAEQMFTRALVGMDKARGMYYPDTIPMAHNLSRLYRDQGKLEEAEQMLTRVLAGKEKTLGIHHHDTLITVDNLSNLYRDQGKLVEAEQMLTRALAGKEKTLGMHHPKTLTTMEKLSNLYLDQGKLAEAEQILERALAGMEKALGMDHPRTLTMVNNLGFTYCHQGKLAEAEQMYTRALAGREREFGMDHPQTLTTVNNLGFLYHNQGKLAEAEQMYTRALVGHGKAFGANHPFTLATARALKSLHSSRDQSDGSEQTPKTETQESTSMSGPTFDSGSTLTGSLETSAVRSTDLDMRNRDPTSTCCHPDCRPDPAELD